MLEVLFNSWLQCCAIVKPQCLAGQGPNTTDPGKLTPVAFNVTPIDNPSWLNQSLRECPLLNEVVVGFSGFEIDRPKLAKVIEGFVQPLMALIGTLAADRSWRSLAPDGSRHLAHKKAQRILVPLTSLVQQTPQQHIPKSFSEISARTLAPVFPQTHPPFLGSPIPQNDFFEKAVGNSNFVDRLLDYVEQFIKLSKVKWECVAGFSLYIVEVGRLSSRSTA